MFVQKGYFHRGYFKIVGQENVSYILFLIMVFYPAKGFRIRFAWFINCQFDGLVTAQTKFFLNSSRSNARTSKIAFRPRDKERRGLIYSIKPRKISIAFAHQIDRQGLENKFVQDVDIVRKALGYLNKSRQIAP